MGALSYSDFAPYAPKFVRGGLKVDRTRNERLISQLPLAYKNSLFLWPNLEHHAGKISALIQACSKLRELGNEQLQRVSLPDRETLILIFPWTVGVSLETHARFAMCLMAIYEDPNSPELCPEVYEMAKSICGDGFPQNAVEACLYIANMTKIRLFWNVLKDKGVKNIETLQDFSLRLLEHVNLVDYDDLDCRAALLETLESSELGENQQQARLCETAVRELEVGFNRLAAEAGIRPPSIDTLFIMLAKWGKGNGKRTSALSPKNGNLVRRVVKAETALP